MRWYVVQANDEGTVRLDPRKLAQFCKQLQHIQKKVVRLQAERLANSQREEAIKVALLHTLASYDMGPRLTRPDEMALTGGTQ